MEVVSSGLAEGQLPRWRLGIISQDAAYVAFLAEAMEMNGVLESLLERWPNRVISSVCGAER